MSDAKKTSDQKKDPDIAAATDRAAAKVPASVDRAGDTTPTKPGTEAARASSGEAESRKLREHPIPKE
jgi:hypothetical protein